MKKYLLLLIVLPFIAHGQIAPKGLKFTSGGLKLDSAIVVANGEVINEIKSFPISMKLQISLRNIRGLTIKDDKSYPGISMKVIDKSGKAVLDYADLLTEYKDGIATEEAKFFVVSLTIGAPMIEKDTYTWRVRVWDKNGKSDFVVEVPVVVGVTDLLGIKRMPGGLTCGSVFLMDTKPLTTNKVDMGTELFFVASGIQGFTVNGDKVKMGAGMVLKDDTGTAILEYTDMLKDQEQVDLKDASTLRLNLTLGEPMLSGKDYTWVLKVWDKASGKKFEASAIIHVN